MPKSGGTPTQLLTVRPRPRLFLEHSGAIYFNTHADQRVTVWPNRGPGSPLATLTVDAQGGAFWEGELIWTTEGGDVNAVNVVTGTTLKIATGQADPWPLVVDDAHVYWANQGEGGSTPHDLHGPRRGAALMRAPRGGGPVETLARSVGLCLNLAASRDALFFSDEGSGRIVRVDRRSWRLTTIAAEQRDVRGLVVDGSTLYWAVNGGKVLRTSETGGNVALVAKSREVRDLAVDREYVYWPDADGPRGTGTLRRIRK